MHLMLPSGLKLACTAVLWHVCDLGLKAARRGSASCFQQVAKMVLIRRTLGFRGPG